MSYVIRVDDLKKRFLIYENPVDRLKEMLFKKRYGDEFWAVKGVSFDVRSGESVGIIGLNGSGKSTLLQMIAGTLSPTEGACEVNGRVSALLELGAGFNPEFSGIDNIYLNATILGLEKEEIDSKLQSIMDFADIGDHVYQPVKTYSSGMFVRLAFAVAAHVEPELLIVDEALSVGDILFQQKCFAYLNGVLKDKTKLFVTHDFSTLTMVADRCLVMHEGCLVFDGPTKEAIKAYNDIIHSNRSLEALPLMVSVPIDQVDTGPTAALHPISIETKTGLMDVDLVAALILINGEETTAVNHGDKVQFTIEVRNAKGVHINGRLVVGFFFRDRFGQQLFGQNTLSRTEAVELGENGVSRLSISFTWPKIKTGEYSLTLGLGLVDPFNDIVHDVQCWCNDFISLECVTAHVEHGVFSVEINDLELS